MAKLDGPLFSLAAHGSIAKRLTYSTRKRVRQVRFQRGQKDYTNLARATYRGYLTTSVSWWQMLDSTEKAEWDPIGSRNN